MHSWFLKLAYSELGAVKNPAPRTDDLKCIGDQAESQKARSCLYSFFCSCESWRTHFSSHLPYIPLTVVWKFSALPYAFPLEFSLSLEDSSLYLRIICSVLNTERWQMHTPSQDSGTTFPVQSHAHWICFYF